LNDAASHYTADERKLLGTRYRSLFVASMFAICCFNFADRAVFAVLAQSMKVDLKLTDFQLGLAQGLAFAGLYSLLGIPFGWLSERFNRVRIVACATIIWSFSTVCCGLVQNFWQLLFARSGVGLGEAGFVPGTSSLVADHFPGTRRASAMSIVMLGTPVGTFLGSLIAGWAAESWTWRTAFYVLGLPGIVSALFIWLVLREPPRGLVDNLPKSPAPPPNLRVFWSQLIHRPAFRYVIIGGALAGFGMTSISTFLAVFLARVHHLPMREAGALYGTISGASIAIGLVIGAFSSDWLAHRDRRWSAWIAMLGLSVAPFIYFFAFRVEARAPAAVVLTGAAAILLLFYGPTLGMIQNLLEPKMRATGVALFTTLYTAIGAGLGPTFVGFMSDRFTQAAFGAAPFKSLCPGGVAPVGSPEALLHACTNASASGVQNALTAAVCVFWLAAISYYMASRTLRRDLYVAPSAAR
jgi:predicted MFS family arabinose efflux permease